jgi:lipoprotein-anchoring transpeptidase ErfK/SrfK
MGDPSPPLVATPSAGPTLSADEQAAAEVRARIGDRRKAGDAAAVEALERRLDTEFADTIEARRHAYDRGVAAAREALREDRPLDARVPVADRARRDLSRGLWIPDLFDAAGKPTETRRTAMATIASLNALVFTYRRGVPGVTTTYEVKPGDSPVRIVSREKLPYGPHVLLYWNHGGNLDPSRLRAGETLVLPTEPLEVRVDRALHLLGLYVGGVLVKEFDVGVGKATTPTHPGTYEVTDKYLNPDWHVPPELLLPGQPRVIPYGDPRNELGDAWIPIASAEHPTGYGIHGTTRPDTVGTDCSNGCVRLRNPEAVEMTNWVRTAKGAGQATRVVIR